MFGKTNIKLLKKGGYVTDGLILHLDGIDYGGQNGKWIDLVNGVIFDVGNKVVKNNKYYSFFNNNSPNSDDIGNSVTTVQQYNNIVTVEVVFNYNATDTNAHYLLCSNNYQKNIRLTANGVLQYGGYSGNAKAVAIEKNKIISASGNYSAIYINGEPNINYVTAQNAYANYSSNIRTAIGGSSGYNWQRFYGNIYSVRIYNRALTAEEIAQNFAVDKARFGI